MVRGGGHVLVRSDTGHKPIPADYEKTIVDCTKVIELDPTDAEAYFYRGMAYRELGEDKKAIADYNQVNQLNPTAPGLYNNRGNAYQKIGEKTKADADFAKAKELGYKQ